MPCWEFVQELSLHLGYVPGKHMRWILCLRTGWDVCLCQRNGGERLLR